MSTHNICFYGELTKIVFKLLSNTHLICSNVHLLKPSPCNVSIISRKLEVPFHNISEVKYFQNCNPPDFIFYLSNCK